MPGFVDLHCHSTASDGTYAPAEVVRLAARRGLSGLALTDHDTAAGLPEAAAEAAAAGIDFLPGIEISCLYPPPGTMHVLGYGVDVDSPVLRRMTGDLLAARDDRNPRIVRRLNELGVDVTMEEVERQAGGAEAVGRPHVAAVLVRKGYANSINQAFDRYLGQGAPAYVDKERLSPRRAMELIRAAGGLPVLAHPVQLRTGNDAHLCRLVKDMVDVGLAGLEVIHSDHDAALVEKYSRLAERFDLLKTGGSDFHGTNKRDINLGLANGRRIPRTYFDAVLERLAGARP